MRKRSFVAVVLCVSILIDEPAIAEKDVGGQAANGKSEFSTFAMSGVLEMRVGYSDLGGGNKAWHDHYVLGSWQLTTDDLINAEISHQNRFDDQGVYFGIGYTRVFNEDWYGSISAGAGAGGFFLPRVRMDGIIHRKWTEKKNLVSGLGATYYKAKDEHSDRTLLLNFLYYSDMPWILELGCRLNESSPGAVYSARLFTVLTLGRNKDRYIILRFETGRESYQLIGPDTVVSDFSSNETILTWRQWISEDYGFDLSAAYYASPAYDRFGILIGIFRDF